MRKLYLMGVILCLGMSSIYSQQGQIIGKVIDKSDSLALPFVSVILYKYQTNKILDYTQTDENGAFAISYPSTSVLTLKTSRLGYQLHQQEIVVGTVQSNTINLTILLNPEVTELSEVTVHGPIIVKEDTVIYDIDQYIEARNETLEDVLTNLPGFKINGDGSIEVDGKTVQKVLLDGEEISDVGSALITRSLSPEDVERLELRTNEKGSKLKESLLDATEYVVLDIHLKEELKQSIFGKIRGTIGYQKDTKTGGFANGFSLKKRSKFHLYAEHDRFGEQSISLQHIKNIGAEAFQKIFEIPADFQELTEREEFENELYGFNNYTQSRKDLVGFSGKYTINDAIDIYFGTYNNYSNDQKERLYKQTFLNGEENTFSETDHIEDLTSKNKLDIRYDTEKVKIKLDLNAVFLENHQQNNNSIQQTGLFYEFGEQHRSHSFYQNLNMEFAQSTRFGFFFKSAVAIVNSDQTRILNHNDTAYDTAFLDEFENPAFNIQQIISNDASNLLIEPGLMIRTKLGSFFSGFLYQRKKLATIKEATSLDSQTNAKLIGFGGITDPLLYENMGPFLQHQISFGKIAFTNRVRHTMLKSPGIRNTQTTQNMFEYSASITGNNLLLDYFSTKFSKNVSSFPLEKITLGREIAGFQTIAIPNNFMLAPQPEYTFEIITSERLNSAKLSIDAAAVYGRIQNSNRFTENENKIFSLQFDQLISEYWLFSLPITKSLTKIPIELILEPELLFNQNQNQTENGDFYDTRTTRYLGGLKINTDLEKDFNFSIYPKYSAFVFQNELSNLSSTQEMLSFDIDLRFDLVKKQMLITPSLRAVNFLGNISSSYTNVDIQMAYRSKKTKAFLTISNLLNQDRFLIQEIFPIYFSSDFNSVFGRFIKIGFEYKFK